VIIQVNPNIIIPRLNIHFSKILHIVESGDKGQGKREWVRVLYRPVIDVPVVLAGLKFTAFLSDEQEPTRLRRLQFRCRDSILYRLVLAYFTAHDHWASQCNITIMYSGHFPALARCIPALALSLHSCASSRSIAHLRVPSRIITFYRASSHFSRIFAFLVHLRVSPRIFAFHCDLVHIIAGASIHCPASSLVRCIPFITISDYVWHRTIIISLWTLTLHHLLTQSTPDSLPSSGKALMCDLGLPCLFLQLSFWQSPSITS
jgi:hypothetical protein